MIRGRGDKVMRVEAGTSLQPLRTFARSADATVRFEVPSGETARVGIGTGASGIDGIDALLVLQGTTDPRDARRRAARRGLDLLDALDGLKAGLIAGRVTPGALSRIRRAVGEAGGATGDPGLDDVLAQVSLRAEVELAKLARATG